MARVGVTVDESRQHRHACRIDESLRAVGPGNLGAGAGGDDAIAIDDDHAVLDDATRRIHADERAAFDAQSTRVSHRGQSPRATSPDSAGRRWRRSSRGGMP